MKRYVPAWLDRLASRAYWSRLTSELLAADPNTLRYLTGRTQKWPK